MIRRLTAEGVPKTRVAARLGISRNTVDRAVASTEPPKYERAPAANGFAELVDYTLGD